MESSISHRKTSTALICFYWFTIP